MTIREFARTMGVSSPTAYRLIHSEGLPGVRVGRAIVIVRERLGAWIYANLGRDVLV
ncbi:MAG: excisionase family DNA-binding protein [Oscillospiraceae bacterium]|jgi:excisionase family DNA binding protein|nr:excisionase family DNA-binding protein [Oscillospiraceae bacterium]